MIFDIITIYPRSTIIFAAVGLILRLSYLFLLLLMMLHRYSIYGQMLESIQFFWSHLVCHATIYA